MQDEKIARPILLGDPNKIEQLIEENQLDLDGCTIINHRAEKDLLELYGKALFEKRKRKGMTESEARRLMERRNYFGMSMLEFGEADAFISGLTKNYPTVIRPALQVIGIQPQSQVVAGMYVVISQQRTLFFADTTVNVDPNVDELVNIIELCQQSVKAFGHEPKIALLSYSNFGSSRGSLPSKMSQAAEIAKLKYPDLIIDGDIQANVALNPQLLHESFSFSALAEKGANTLIFPNLAAGNIAYKLLQELGVSETIGPILLGMNKPVQILQRGSSVREIVNMGALAAVNAQNNA